MISSGKDAHLFSLPRCSQHSQDVSLLICLTFDTEWWLECGSIQVIAHNQLIALTKEEHAELNGQETQRVERLINILLGPHGYMMGGGVNDGRRRGILNAKMLRGLATVCWKLSRYQSVCGLLDWTAYSFWIITSQHFSAVTDADGGRGYLHKSI